MRAGFRAGLRAGVCVVALMGGGRVLAQTAHGASETNLQEVVVTARRTAENLQTAPVAVSVITPKTMDLKGVFRPDDLAEKVPGLTVTTQGGTNERDMVTYSIRGQNWAYGTIFPAVITYFDEVPVALLSAGSFFDLSDVQVLRGPQGVLFGRVTDGGNVLINTKRPGNAFDGYVEVKVGDYGLNNYSGAIGGAIIPDVLMVRGGFEVDRRDGFTTNVYNGQKLDNVGSEAYRAAVTFKPVRGFENDTIVQYQHIHNNGTGITISALNPGTPDPYNGKIGGIIGSTASTFALFPGAYGINPAGDVVPFRPGLTPLTTPNYIADLQQQLARQQALGPRQVYQTLQSYDRRENLYVVNSTTVDLTPDIQFKNIFGYINTVDWSASNFGGANGAYVLTCEDRCGYLNGSAGAMPFVAQGQFSDEVRFSGKALNQRLTWSLGAYFDYQFPSQQFENQTINLGILSRTDVNYVTNREKAGSGYVEYDASDFVKGLKFNGGLRYSTDSVDSIQNNYISPIFSPLAFPSFLAVAPFVLEAQGIPPAIASAIAPGLAAATVNTPTPYGQCVNFPAGIFASPCIHYRAASHALTWQAGVSYQLPSGQLIYVEGSRGYRPGGVNGTAPPGALASYNPEFVTQIEVGFKGDFHVGDWRFRPDLALYHDSYDHIQELNTIIGAGNVPSSVVTNVASALIEGAEVELTVQPIRALTINVNYAYTYAHYHGINPHAGTSNDPCSPAVAGPTIGFCPFNSVGNTPKNQIGVSLDYILPLDEAIGTVSVGGHYYYQSSMNSSRAAPEPLQPAYDLLDLSVAWHQIFGRPVDASFFMTNVTNTLYPTVSNYLLQNSSLGMEAKIWGPPRMFGFGLKYRFGASAGG